MFSTKHYEIRHVLDGSLLGPVGQKRLLAHVIANISQEILSAPGANPLGLSITVTVLSGHTDDRRPNLLVTATCPHYELTDSFFD